jgi:hypothetical protein
LQMSETRILISFVKTLSSDVVRTQHAHPQYFIDCSSLEHLSEDTWNAP